MKCLECHSEVEQIDNAHLAQCCGLTLQEYAIRHHVSLDLLVNESMVNVKDQLSLYSLPAEQPSVRSNSVLQALLFTNSFKEEDEYLILPNEVRRLDELLWYLRELTVYGFQFRQEYSYTSTTHRVVPENKIKMPNKYRHKLSKQTNNVDFSLYLAVIVAQSGELRKGYVFLSLPCNQQTRDFLKQLTNDYQIRWAILENEDCILTRTESLEDAQRLFALIEPSLKEIPCIAERYFADIEEATVSKELVFDSAHFITDHPGKCENLHGGRYTLNVKIKDRIDPLTGFVIDYGYLKMIVKKQVTEKLDHQNLNYVCSDLGWRSSTELLNIFIWEQLIDFLPGLVELQTYETTQSYCQYQGPSLEEIQKNQINFALKHFSRSELGDSLLRQQLKTANSLDNLKVVKK